MKMNDFEDYLQSLKQCFLLPVRVMQCFTHCWQEEREFVPGCFLKQ